MNISAGAHRAQIDEASLWERQSTRIFRYLLRLTGNRETAEDLTQDTFVQAIKSLRQGVDAPTNEAAWLFRIATNRATDLFRRRRLISWLPFLAERHGGEAGDAAEQVATQDLVLQALRKLPPETASLLLLKDAEGFTSQEIAAMLGQNYEAVRKRLARARETFRVEYLRLRGDH